MFIKTAVPQDGLTPQLLPILVEASALLKAQYDDYCAGQAFDIEKKLDDSPVTQADLKIHQYLAAELASVSDLPLLSEEGQHHDRQQWTRFWLLDPLDGTKEFLKQRAEFTINLSLIEHHSTTFAILAAPAKGVIYFCPEQGLPLKYDLHTQQWWRYQHAQSNSSVKIGVSQSAQQKQHYATYLEALHALQPYQTVRAGSAYKFCLMLEDEIDLYPRFHPTYEWDTSAGQCFLERIGGGLVDLHGKAFHYNARDSLLNGNFIAYRDEVWRTLAFQALAPMS